MRHPLVMGNWKLNGSTHMVNELIAGLRNELSSVDGCGAAIAPPVMYLDQAKHALAGSRIALGAQNVDVNLSGAFTGEVSANMLKDVGGMKRPTPHCQIGASICQFPAASIHARISSSAHQPALLRSCRRLTSTAAVGHSSATIKKAMDWMAIS